MLFIGLLLEVDQARLHRLRILVFRVCGGGIALILVLLEAEEASDTIETGRSAKLLRILTLLTSLKASSSS